MGVAEELRTLAGAWDEWGLGGKLTELAERLERQEVVSDEDAEAARWVREHGGVGFLEIHLPNLWSFIDHIMDRLGVDKSDIDGPELVDEELDRRLMPPGYEWPRFDDGEKVKFGEVGLDVHGKRRSAEGIKFTQGGFTFVSDDMGGTWWGNDSGPIEDPSVDYSKRVKRPAVLAADGEPLGVGQTVYVIANGKTHHVTEVDAVSKRFRSMEQADGSHWLDPMCFTHQRPVLDADGVPIKVGETVYAKATWKDEWLKFRVMEVRPDGRCLLLDVDVPTNKPTYEPCEIVHTKPEPHDSYCRLYADMASDLASRNGKARTPNGISFGDFVRRAKALAERERDE